MSDLEVCPVCGGPCELELLRRGLRVSAAAPVSAAALDRERMRRQRTMDEIIRLENVHRQYEQDLAESRAEGRHGA